MFEELGLSLTIWEMAFGIFGIIIGGFLRGFLGFGAALLIVPVLSIILTPVEAIAIFLLIEMPTVAYLMPSAIREFDSKSIVIMVVGLVLAVPVGSYALVSIDSGPMKLIIAIIVLMLVGLLASGWTLKGKVSSLAMLFAGIIGGFAQGAAGAGGPPFVTVLLSRGDDQKKTRANIVMTLNCLTIMGTVTLFAYGAFTLPLLITSILIVPLFILSAVIGVRYFRESGNEHFRKAALVVLALTAIMLIYSII